MQARRRLSDALKDGLFGPLRTGFQVSIRTREGVYDLRKMVPWNELKQLPKTEKVDLNFRKDPGCIMPLSSTTILLLEHNVLNPRKNLVVVLTQGGKQKWFAPSVITNNLIGKWSRSDFDLAIRLMTDAKIKIEKFYASRQRAALAEPITPQSLFITRRASPVANTSTKATPGASNNCFKKRIVRPELLHELFGSDCESEDGSPTTESIMFKQKTVEKTVGSSSTPPNSLAQQKTVPNMETDDEVSTSSSESSSSSSSSSSGSSSSSESSSDSDS